MTCSKMAGQSSRSQPCSVMSGHTPVAMSWSMARTTSTLTPWRRMISMRDVGEPLGVGQLRRALERAVDEQRAQVAEVPPGLVAQLLLLRVEDRHDVGAPCAAMMRPMFSGLKNSGIGSVPAWTLTKSSMACWLPATAASSCCVSGGGG